ncbi:MAG: MarR family transcriptional regulator [Kordiimonadaceae bacterium]|jgi:DNA-binding MarR family transcriptional regulator/ribosomal protein S18 acetylase RimI-like enzyme|nr:MarR family transcriptional regulator [Kordiimonadaceae bacterium]
MSKINNNMLTDIRTASRELVRKFGFMNQTLAGINYSPSAVHAIIEIGEEGIMSGKKLSQRLYLEKSSISRLVRNLIKNGEIYERKSDQDARQKDLLLTAKGKKTLSDINNFGSTQVSNALSALDNRSRITVLQGLVLYADALNSKIIKKQITIHEGYRTELIGVIAALHGKIHGKIAGLGAPFEGMVAAGLADFIPRHENTRNKIWYGEQDGKIMGSITIDGEELGNNIGHLRWFIVDTDIQSSGLGGKLIQKAMDFCDQQKFDEIHLWTYKGLDAAKNLYEKHGFKLVEEVDSDQWGVDLTVQKYVRERKNNDVN